MKLLISERILDKLEKRHRVTQDEIRQCFENRNGSFLEDLREQHRTDPPTQWFISETNQCRKLKVVFVQRQFRDLMRFEIRTAYEPNADEIRIYEKHGGPV